MWAFPSICLPSSFASIFKSIAESEPLQPEVGAVEEEVRPWRGGGGSRSGDVAYITVVDVWIDRVPRPHDIARVKQVVAEVDRAALREVVAKGEC